MAKMRNIIPWRTAQRWYCFRCGACCRAFIVPIRMAEAWNLISKYGPVVVSVSAKQYLLKKDDGSCIFLANYGQYATCQIYFERPRCCRLFPFQIYTEPPLDAENGDKALLPNSEGGKLYVYLNKKCPGVGRGYEITALLPRIVQLWKECGRLV